MVDAAAERPEGITPNRGEFRPQATGGGGKPTGEKKSRGALVGASRALGLVGASSATCASNVVVVPAPRPHRTVPFTFPSPSGPQSPSSCCASPSISSPPFPSSLAASLLYSQPGAVILFL
ncbi:hypothetical protein BS78_01G112600 [Paspalum vaginatum]|nr:hypothetical protein BS78_01G112600 [Paspalum vaginatum]